MRYLIACIFKFLFKFNFFKQRFFGIHKRIIEPINLFKGVKVKTKYSNLILQLNIEDWIQENIYFLGEYEKAELKSIETFLDKNSVFIDIGANIGLYSLYASKKITEKGKIISFEPFSKNHKTLVKNVEINQIDNIIVEKIAIGNEEKQVNLHYNEAERNLGMVTTNPNQGAKQEAVNATSLDTYLENKKISRLDLIKIDIEGYEYQALSGMRKTLQKFKPSLLIEILDDKEDLSNYKRIEELLLSFGYRKYYIDDLGKLSQISSYSNRKNYIFSVKNLLDN
jgi:FkbM family methyltransferase